MFVLDGGTRVVVPRTELTYPGHNMKLHTNAASAEKRYINKKKTPFVKQRTKHV